jgi:alpha-beta hydrolase superfamily lysophospholipase
MILRLILGALAMTELYAAPVEEVSFATQDGGVVYADLYGAGNRGVVLAHGMKFDKASWKVQAEYLASAGFRVAAIDFRGYGKSHAGAREDMYLDVLAAVTYLRGKGASSVAVIGGSMGGGASANAAAKGGAGAMDRLILLAPVPIANPEAIRCPKFYVTAKRDSIAAQVQEQFQKAGEPKELLLLDGDAHAQFLFKSEHNELLLKEIVRFLSAH